MTDQADDDLWNAAKADAGNPASDPPNPDDANKDTPKPTQSAANPEKDAIAARVEEMRRLGGRLGNEIQARRAVEAENARLKAELEAAKGGAATPKLEKFEAMKKDAPDWAGAVEEFVDSKLKPSKAEPAQQTLTATELEALRVEKYHPGWQDIVKTPQFDEWLNGADPDIKKLAQSPLGDDVVEMMDHFMEHIGTPRELTLAEKRRQMLRNAAALPSRSTTTHMPPVPDSQLDEEALWKQESAKVFAN